MFCLLTGETNFNLQQVWNGEWPWNLSKNENYPVLYHRQEEIHHVSLCSTATHD